MSFGEMFDDRQFSRKDRFSAVAETTDSGDEGKWFEPKADVVRMMQQSGRHSGGAEAISNPRGRAHGLTYVDSFTHRGPSRNLRRRHRINMRDCEVRKRELNQRW